MTLSYSKIAALAPGFSRLETNEDDMPCAACGDPGTYVHYFNGHKRVSCAPCYLALSNARAGRSQRGPRAAFKDVDA